MSEKFLSQAEYKKIGHQEDVRAQAINHLAVRLCQIDQNLVQELKFSQEFDWRKTESREWLIRLAMEKYGVILHQNHYTHLMALGKKTIGELNDIKFEYYFTARMADTIASQVADIIRGKGEFFVADKKHTKDILRLKAIDFNEGESIFEHLAKSSPAYEGAW